MSSNEVNYAVIIKSGKILRVGVCSSGSRHLQAGDGELLKENVPNHVRDDTHFFDGGLYVEYPPSPGAWAEFDFDTRQWFDPRTADDLANEVADERKQAIATVNTMIGKIRSKFVTVIPAQDMLYQAKEAEAKAYLAASDPVEAEYPFIHAEIGITGEDAWQVAQVYVNQAMILRLTAAQLETVRLGHIARVEAATDVEEIDAILSGFETTVRALL